MIANALNLEPFLVPAPSDIAQALWHDRGLLADNAWVTLQEVLAGFALSVAAGVAFAIVLHLSPTVRRAVYPLLVASQTVPIVVVAPILVVWLGFGIGPKLAIIALICFFPITVNTLDGLELRGPGPGEDDAHARRQPPGRPSGASRVPPRCPTSSAAPRSPWPSP